MFAVFAKMWKSQEYLRWVCALKFVHKVQVMSRHVKKPDLLVMLPPCRAGIGHKNVMLSSAKLKKKKATSLLCLLVRLEQTLVAVAYAAGLSQSEDYRAVSGVGGLSSLTFLFISLSLCLSLQGLMASG